MFPAGYFAPTFFPDEFFARLPVVAEGSTYFPPRYFAPRWFATGYFGPFLGVEEEEGATYFPPRYFPPRWFSTGYFGPWIEDEGGGSGSGSGRRTDGPRRVIIEDYTGLFYPTAHDRQQAEREKLAAAIAEEEEELLLLMAAAVEMGLI